MGLKFLLLVLLLAVVAGWWFTRSRRSRPPHPPPTQGAGGAKNVAPAEAIAMLSCAHCRVHLPRDEAQFDVAGKPFCSAEHRVAGPR